jgi:hypothetical protein
MPALAGREGEVIWALTERHTKNDNRIYEKWATERAGIRGSTSSDAEYVKSWLNLDQTSRKEIEGVREIVLVTQGVLLQTLLGRGNWAMEGLQIVS